MNKGNTNQVKADEPDDEELIIVATKTKEGGTVLPPNADESIFDCNCVAGDDASNEKAQAEHHHVLMTLVRCVSSTRHMMICAKNSNEMEKRFHRLKEVGFVFRATS